MLRNTSLNFICISLVFFLVLILADALEINSVKEGHCDNAKPKILKDFDFKWASTAKGKWYFPLMSKLDFYRSIEDLLPDQPLDKFTEDDVKKSCFTMQFSKPTEVSITGFGGTPFQYNLIPTRENTINFKALKPSGKEGLRSSAYITLTDNRNYIVFINCWKDGLKSWSVASMKKKLSKKANDKIRNHLESMGFNMQLAYEDNYTSCTENKINNNDEL